MVKKTFLVLMCLISLIIFVSVLYGQGSKKTVILSSGEAVCDLNGEWDALYENLGAFQWVGNIKDMLKITQQGGSFVGVKMIGSPYVPKDAVSIKGELDKNGIKNVRVVLNTFLEDIFDCKGGQISEDGNKIIIDGGERIKVTLTRKLPSGEVVCDLNGEWDAIVENYGPSASSGSYPQIEKITQTGSSFVAIRMIDDPWNLKGSQSFQGELDRSGIKKVTILTAHGPVEAKGQISNDGNKIVIDDGKEHRLTLTRK